ncbi:MAG: glycosyltransferase family 2 protein [Acidobacteriia bacterium]|nr:glycosyltransferase family 2 protein [Terriglobia bacterium]
MGNEQAQSAPRVSIIIPSYNTAHLIAACLDSIFAQTFQNFEAIVVNDGSPDTPELEKVLQPYLDRIVYIKQVNKRAAGARNTAIAKARGEFLAFLDSDDTWLPNHLESQMKQFDSNPAYCLVYANAVLVGDPTRHVEFMERCPSVGEAGFEAQVVERCQIPVSTVVARKAAVLSAGGFDESLTRCDDYNMWLRTAFYGGKVGYTRQVQARLADGRPGSLGLSRAKMAEAYWSILEKADKDLPLSPAQRKLVRDRAAQIRAKYLLEDGKIHLSARDFPKARECFSEANHYFRKAKLSLVLFGLKVAPNATSRLFAFLTQRHNGAPA